jgi:hypothetical protein
VGNTAICYSERVVSKRKNSMFHTNSFVSGSVQSIEQIDAQVRGALYTTFLVLGQIVGALTSRQANRTYRSIWYGMVIAAQFTIWLGMISRDFCRAHVMPEIDYLVERALPEPCSEGDTADAEEIAAEFAALVQEEQQAAETVTAEALQQQYTIRELKSLASQYKITGYGRMVKSKLAQEVAKRINGVC